MNYDKIYENLILKGRTQEIHDDVYYVMFHIIPKHVGGLDTDKNLVSLTHKQHTFAHVLLYKIYGRWQDKLALNAIRGVDINARHAAKVESGKEQYRIGKEIHQQTIEERKQFGERLAKWNKENPEKSGLTKSHITRNTKTSKLKFARIHSKFIYIDPNGYEWDTRFEAAEHYNVPMHSIENWGKREQTGWSRKLR